MRTKRKNANAEYEPLAQHRAAQVNSLLRVDRADQRPVETVELPEICPLTGEAKGNDRELRFGHDFDPGDGAEALGCPERQVQFFIQVAAEGPDPVHLDGEPHPEAFAPATPVRIDIPSIAVSAPVDPVGLNPDGSLQAPKDFDRAGYYTGRPTPGEIGPAIIEGHVDSPRRPAVFYGLRKLRGGDEVVITRVDGTRPVFVVDRLEEHPKDAFPTKEVYGPVPAATLRLITCAGTFNRRAGHYRDNLIVFAHLKGMP